MVTKQIYIIITMTWFLYGDATYLFRTTGGDKRGDKGGDSGFYGGYIDTELSPYKSDNLSDIAYSDVNIKFNGSSVFNQLGLNDDIPSIDPISKQMIIQIKQLDTLTVIKAELCKGKLHRLYYDADLKPVFITRRIGSKTLSGSYDDNPRLLSPVGITSVTMYDSKIYFVLFGSYGKPSDQLQVTKLELRVFEGCEDTWLENLYPGSPYPPPKLNLVTCSRLIKTLGESESVNLESDDDWSLKTVGGAMKIFKQGNQLAFLTLLLNKNYTDNKMSIDLHFVIDGGPAKILHSEFIDKDPTTIDGIHALGVDYKDGQICWSTSVNIHCGSLINNQLENPRKIIQPGQIKNVCKYIYDPSEDKYVTGVAILNSTALYFGCRHDPDVISGFGLVYEVEGDANQYVQPVTETNGAKISGGMIFLLADIPECPIIYTTTTERPTNIGIKPKGLNMFVMLLVLMLCTLV
ncbi:unnamed protein product [Owenia fusiformis]|uniref:Uncharacterized protein n=1 Tax=Owenia fusiformis TaxID=6347 RepID=A0A8J1TD54_OWEFU|nr:unnamed protein product [Owenia fusiformis]